jgi:hypothetical protein
MYKKIAVIALFLLIFIFCNCQYDINNKLFDGNIVGSKWNVYQSPYDKTIIFETENTAHMIDKNSDTKQIYNTYFTYSFDPNTWIGELFAVEENMLGGDFAITKDGDILVIKNQVVELVFNRIK